MNGAPVLFLSSLMLFGIVGCERSHAASRDYDALAAVSVPDRPLIQGRDHAGYPSGTRIFRDVRLTVTMLDGNVYELAANPRIVSERARELVVRETGQTITFHGVASHRVDDHGTYHVLPGQPPPLPGPPAIIIR